MPVLRCGQQTIDLHDVGHGRAVVLLHSSASGHQQWHALAATLRDRHRVIAPNLLGYGETSPWTGPQPQKLSDQADLVRAVLEDVEGPVDFVGHSFGALVALETAKCLPEKVGRLVLFEPNPFALLDRPGFAAEYAEIQVLHHDLTSHRARGDWAGLAERFADYFAGDGTWHAMPAEQRVRLAGLLPPNVHEWEAVMDPSLRLSAWQGLAAPTLLVWSRDTRPALRALAGMLLAAYDHWQGHELERGGHLAPIFRPRPFNQQVERFLG